MAWKCKASYSNCNTAIKFGSIIRYKLLQTVKFKIPGPRIKLQKLKPSDLTVRNFTQSMLSFSLKIYSLPILKVKGLSPIKWICFPKPQPPSSSLPLQCTGPPHTCIRQGLPLKMSSFLEKVRMCTVCK